MVWKILLALLLCGSVQASEIIIISAAPHDRQTARVVPSGYQKCHRVDAGWYHGQWVNRHKVCNYRHHSYHDHRHGHGSVWVDGYWRCDKYDKWHGTCQHWHWVRSHWSRGYEVY